MSAVKVNKAVLKKYSLKKLAKQKKKMAGGDAAFISNRILNRNK